jgi:hypothetical protein
MRLAAGVVIACALAVSAEAAAQIASSTVALEYVAPEECPDRRAFDEELAARAPLAARAVPLRVTIAREGDMFRGTLEVVHRDAPSVRALESAQCTDVARGLALVAALALSAEVEAPAETAPSTPPPIAIKTAAAPPERSVWRWSAGARIALARLIAGELSPSVPVFVAVERESDALLAFDRPVFRAGGWFARSSFDVAPGAQASFTWIVGRAEACPVTLRSEVIHGDACLRFDAGRLSSTADGVAQPGSHPRPWLAPGIAARLAWQASRAIAFEVDGGLSAPLVRDRFTLKNGPVFQADRVVFEVAAGVAVSFW